MPSARGERVEESTDVPRSSSPPLAVPSTTESAEAVSKETNSSKATPHHSSTLSGIARWYSTFARSGPSSARSAQAPSTATSTYAEESLAERPFSPALSCGIPQRSPVNQHHLSNRYAHSSTSDGGRTGMSGQTPRGPRQALKSMPYSGSYESSNAFTPPYAPVLLFPANAVLHSFNNSAHSSTSSASVITNHSTLNGKCTEKDGEMNSEGLCFAQAVHHAFPGPSFLSDPHVKHYCTAIAFRSSSTAYLPRSPLLTAPSGVPSPTCFLLLSRFTAQRGVQVYAKQKKKWECIPHGHARIFVGKWCDAKAGRHQRVSSLLTRDKKLSETGGEDMGGTFSFDSLEHGSTGESVVRALLGSEGSGRQGSDGGGGAAEGATTITNASFDSTACYIPTAPNHRWMVPEGEPLAAVAGLRKFGSTEDGNTLRTAFVASKQPMTHAYALERVDGESGVISAFVHDGVSYWLIGSLERHVVVDLHVSPRSLELFLPPQPSEKERKETQASKPDATASGVGLPLSAGELPLPTVDADLGSSLSTSSAERGWEALNREVKGSSMSSIGSERMGDAEEIERPIQLTESAQRAAALRPTGHDRLELVLRMARCWGNILQWMPVEEVLRLHHTVSESKWTLCFTAVLSGWEGLVQYPAYYQTCCSERVSREVAAPSFEPLDSSLYQCSPRCAPSCSRHYLPTTFAHRKASGRKTGQKESSVSSPTALMGEKSAPNFSVDAKERVTEWSASIERLDLLPCSPSEANGEGGSTQPQRTEPDDGLIFFAITKDEPSVNGLCIPVPQSQAFFQSFSPYIPFIPSSPCLPLGSPEFEALQQDYLNRIHCAGAVFYGVAAPDAAGEVERVVKLWKGTSVSHQLEHAAQEWVLTHQLCGPALKEKMQRKVASLVKRWRVAGRQWGAARIDFLADFSHWLCRTHQLTPSSSLEVVRQIRGTWVSRQMLFQSTHFSEISPLHLPPSVAPASSRRSVEASSSPLPWGGRGLAADSVGSTSSLSSSEPFDSESEGATPDLLLMAGPQGCGKSTLSRALAALLEEAGQSPCWINQDELGSRAQYVAALAHFLKHPRAHTHAILDKTNLTDALRRRDADAVVSAAGVALRPLITVVWYHPSRTELAKTCWTRVMGRGGRHRSLKVLHSAQSVLVSAVRKRIKEEGGANSSQLSRTGTFDPADTSITGPGTIEEAQTCPSFDSELFAFSQEKEFSACSVHDGKALRKQEATPRGLRQTDTFTDEDEVHHTPSTDSAGSGSDASSASVAGSTQVSLADEVTRAVIEKAVMQYDLIKAKHGDSSFSGKDGVVMLDVNESVSGQLKKVWEVLVRLRENDEAKPKLPVLSSLDLSGAVRIAFAYENVIEAFPERPQQAVLEAVSTSSVVQSVCQTVLSMLEAPLEGEDVEATWLQLEGLLLGRSVKKRKKMKRRCRTCCAPLFTFSDQLNPTAMVYFARLHSQTTTSAAHVVPVTIRRIIGDVQATIAEAYVSSSYATSCGKIIEGGSLAAPSESEEGKDLFASWSAPPPYALTAYVSSPLLLPLSSTRKGSTSAYRKDLYHRAVENAIPDPFCTVIDMPACEEAAPLLFRVRLVSSAIEQGYSEG